MELIRAEIKSQIVAKKYQSKALQRIYSLLATHISTQLEQQKSGDNIQSMEVLYKAVYVLKERLLQESMDKHRQWLELCTLLRSHGYNESIKNPYLFFVKNQSALITYIDSLEISGLHESNLTKMMARSKNEIENGLAPSVFAEINKKIKDPNYQYEK